MTPTVIATILTGFVMSFGGTQITKAATNLNGNVTLRTVAALFAALGIVGSKVASTGTFDPTDAELLLTSLVQVIGVTFSAHLFYKGAVVPEVDEAVADSK